MLTLNFKFPSTDFRLLTSSWDKTIALWDMNSTETTMTVCTNYS